MKKILKKYVRRYFVPALILLVVLSTVGVNLVFAKYASNKDDTVNVSVSSYSGEISVALRDGETATEFAPHNIKLIPGNTYEYDPYVYISNNAADRNCYLFVKVEEIGGTAKVAGKNYGFSDFIDYKIDESWTCGDGTSIPSNVYYREVPANTTAYYNVFKNDSVNIKESAPELGFLSLLTAEAPAFGIRLYALEITELEATDSASAWNWLMLQEATDSESEGGEGGATPEPDYDFNGAEYNIYARGERHENLWCTASPNTIVEKAASVRNLAIEQEYNVKIKNVGIDGQGNFLTMLENGAKVDETSVDLIVPDYYFFFEHMGYLRDLRAIEELDFSQSYWDPVWNDTLSYNGRQYKCVGNATPDLEENFMVAFFNTETVKTLGIDPYDMVRKDTWTLDEVHSIAKRFMTMHAEDNANVALASTKLHSLSVSTDGSGNKTTTVYLFRHYNAYDMSNEGVKAILFASGLRLSEKAEDGTLRLIADSDTANYDRQERARCFAGDKMADYKITFNAEYDEAAVRANLTAELVDPMRTNTSPGRFVRPATERAQETEKNNALKEGRTFLSVRWLGAGGQLNNDSFTNYGFVPLPKYDADADYVSYQYGISPFAIPVNSPDPVKSAVILDAMNRMSDDFALSTWNFASPGENINANDDLKEMMGIIRGGVYAEFLSYMSGYDGMDIYEAFYDCTYDPNKNINYEMDKALKTYDIAIANIMQIYFGASTTTASE